MQHNLPIGLAVCKERLSFYKAVVPRHSEIFVFLIVKRMYENAIYSVDTYLFAALKIKVQFAPEGLPVCKKRLSLLPQRLRQQSFGEIRTCLF
jgi:hypothetical protein